jgi:hypothetical protein
VLGSPVKSIAGFDMHARRSCTSTTAKQWGRHRLGGDGRPFERARLAR